MFFGFARKIFCGVFNDEFSINFISGKFCKMKKFNKLMGGDKPNLKNIIKKVR